MKKILVGALLSTGLACYAQAAPEIGPAQLVDALNGTFGSHSGKRASHAKGICADGEFVPASTIGDFVQSPLFAQQKIPANVRFSIGGGNPNASDKSRTVRGLAIRLSGNDEMYDLLLISEPAFFAATPASFVGFLQARVPDPSTGKPDPAKTAAHNEAFPDGSRQPALLASHAAPASYASTPYFSNNAFVFSNRHKVRKTARIIVEPDAPLQYLTADDEKNLPDAFLEEELGKRLTRGVVTFSVAAQLPDAQDSLIDPSTVWKGDSRVELGQLRISRIAPQSSCDGIVYMPVALPKGIALTPDPILQSRAAAYSVSLSRRSK